MSQLVAHEHALVLAKSGSSVGLARRLADGTLRPPEREELARVEAIVAMEEERLGRKEIAARLGWTGVKLQQYVSTDKVRLFRKWLAERPLLAVEGEAQSKRQVSRRRFDAYDDAALDYFGQAFRRYTSHVYDDRDKKKIKYHAGDFVDLDRAERASYKVAAAQGWLEPVPTHTKPKDLSPGVIQAQMLAIRQADNKEMVVRVTTQSGETVEVGVRNQQSEEVV